ncbi:hypothetical protein MCOR25_010518 [Pyricularia grisea]|nr:hypothetical protein MCOR25_010518 [Pyricularia grisea]
MWAGGDSQAPGSALLGRRDRCQPIADALPARRPPYRLLLCTPVDGRVFAKLDVSHLLLDGRSKLLMLRKLVDAFDRLGEERQAILSRKPCANLMASAMKQTNNADRRANNLAY